MRHSSFLEVNLGMLAGNVDRIRRLTSSQILPMVKADAYGNGLVPISRFLVEECKLKKIGCASLGEAMRIFQECPGLDAEVLVFSDTEIQDPVLRKAYLQLNMTPVLHLKSDVEAVLNDPDFRRVPLVIKLNTGMNRLGLTRDELESLVPRLKGRGVKHLMTHFACSYYPLKDGDKTHRQMQEFQDMKKMLEASGVSVEETSVANSGAIEQNFGTQETYVRPGLMLYGPYSVVPRLWEGNQISRLVTKVIKTFPVKKGTPIGYGINVAGEDGFMAVIPLGYGDGITTYASGVEINVKGMKGKFFGRINMDMTFIMFERSVEGKIKVGDEIEVWNHDNRVISDIATQMKTIPYQLMCGISGRIPRIYKVK